MKVIGKHFTTNAEGKQFTTLHISEEFEQYYQNADAGRGCLGQKASTIYVGDFDCDDIKIGSEIDISYGKAVSTKNGIYQPIKDISIINQTK